MPTDVNYKKVSDLLDQYTVKNQLIDDPDKLTAVNHFDYIYFPKFFNAN